MTLEVAYYDQRQYPKPKKHVFLVFLELILLTKREFDLVSCF